MRANTLCRMVDALEKLQEWSDANVPVHVAGLDPSYDPVFSVYLRANRIQVSDRRVLFELRDPGKPALGSYLIDLREDGHFAYGVPDMDDGITISSEWSEFKTAAQERGVACVQMRIDDIFLIVEPMQITEADEPTVLQ
jgi:hypothetical protein